MMNNIAPAAIDFPYGTNPLTNDVKYNPINDVTISIAPVYNEGLELAYSLIDLKQRNKKAFRSILKSNCQCNDIAGIPRVRSITNAS
jgi:hypothetical protein